ncbi:3-dehydroquinate dehydratase [Listeria floridensis FSL S10-1187]|uniref:3-dehydroquinate dehydratase n=1 Tax=Listeria floridensis FSL S10-1187 TaxID=1265817 RepID=A0ABN0RC59_9LIST|nr:type I 3-dehydroquinate dehydratase [Listeria floridensis]EUJ26367.1 3-dehydroquinate dehydratase [Listeria floridensis FSL S10-1187]
METVKVKRVEIGDGHPKICVPLVGKTIADLKREAKQAGELATDLIEWRADCFAKVEDLETVKWALREFKPFVKDKPLLFTFRTKAEGGEAEIKESFYYELNRTLIRTKEIDLIDLELFHDEDELGELIEEAHQAGIKVLMSSHDFKSTPAKTELISRIKEMERLGADITKVAVMPQTGTDTLVLLDTAAVMNMEAVKPFVAIAMGELGILSRLSGRFFGSAITYAALEKTSAPGQISVEATKRILNAVQAKQIESFTEL